MKNDCDAGHIGLKDALIPLSHFPISYLYFIMASIC